MSSQCQITVNQGVLRGKECVTCEGKKYFSFEGVPYAKPPVGELRFKNPVALEPWTGILDATKPGNKCIQSKPPYAPSSPLEGSEDCLYLNIYTPSLPPENTEKLPVIFFIHGGKLVFGNGDYYTPDYFIKNEVIFISFNYRLHVLGWLCLNIPECPGNAGLKDSLMALRWVNENIKYFNGDENNVTLFGESAGAAMAGSFLTSDLTDGLFSKIITQSGTSISDIFFTEDDYMQNGISIVSNLGEELTDEREIYEYLSKAPIEDLVFAYTKAEMSHRRTIIDPYLLPVVEKKFEGVERFLSEHPRVAIRQNRFKKVPILTTANSHESAVFFSKNGQVIYEPNFEYFVPQYAKLPTYTKQREVIAEKIRKFYLKEKSLDDSSKKEYIEMVSDVYFWRDIFLFAEFVSEHWDQLYTMQFNYCGGMHTKVMKSIGLQGATHVDMIQYQFYWKRKAKHCTEKDKKIVDFLSDVMCNFARNGKPTWSSQSTSWHPYNKDNRYTLVVDDTIELQSNIGINRLKFWSELSKNYCNAVMMSKL